MSVPEKTAKSPVMGPTSQSTGGLGIDIAAPHGDLEAESDFFDRLNADFMRDPRYAAITSALSDPRLITAVFSIFDRIATNNLNSCEPLFVFPQLPKNKVIHSLSLNPTGSNNLVSRYMYGAVDFKQSWQPFYQEPNAGKREGFPEHRFFMEIRADKDGKLLVRTDYSDLRAQVELRQQGIMPYKGHLSLTVKDVYERLCWFSADGVGDIIEHLDFNSIRSQRRSK